MVQELKGKSAVVTGGGDGIGRATALALAEAGASVVVNDIGREKDDKSAADSVVEEIKEVGGTAVANYDSVASMQGGKNIIQTAVSNFGHIDILVNCAGNFKQITTMEITEDDWDSIMAVHLKGHFSCIKAALPEMIKQKNGRIINISSRAATFGAASPAYNTAKAGILGFTSMLSEEQRENGITVNVILPSARTKLFSGPAPSIGDNMPISSERGPEFVAPVIAFLATDQARNITGKYIYSSGGYICIYARPLQLPGEAHILLGKSGKWTIEELGQVLIPLIG
ncbi:MAG TPA: SDR family NAD(P)-dependent oxidoreductase [Dehalococcoidia bacterium]|nr:SDR family NAD(P)-dependent oxidoreductase [Dehalococcoidia bacterium]